MDRIMNDIINLKEKINNEIESLSYYKELSYICDALKNELNNYEYDIDNAISLKKYKAYLEVFLENRIGFINNLIINKQNNSIFDNRSIEEIKKLEDLKSDISSLLTYIEDNFPIVGKEVMMEYEKINNYYNNVLLYTMDSSKRRFNLDTSVSKEPVLSIYSDTSSVINSYINKLEAFKNTHVNSIKIFVDNDIKVKDLFKRAYETLKDEIVIEAVKELEYNYLNEINKCVNSNILYANTNILLIQENMIKNGLQLDEIIKKEKERNNYYQIIENMNINYNNIEELLEIEKYVNNNNVFEEKFYLVLYALIEKEKYLSVKYGNKPKLYNAISEKSKVTLEKMFLNHLKELNDDEKEEMVIKLKKYGYFNVLDKNYKDFFDNQDIIVEAKYRKESKENNYKLECKYVNKGIIEQHYNIINKENGKVVDRLFDTCIIRFDNLGDIYSFEGKKIKALKEYEFHRYYSVDGKITKTFKNESKVIKRVFDLLLINKDGKLLITDLNFNIIFDLNTLDIKIDNNKQNFMLVDYSKKNILIKNDNYFYLFNQNFCELKRVKVTDIINEEKTFKDYYGVSILSDKFIFNDGIVPINVYVGASRYIYYYDIINMKKIDLFSISLSSNALYGYNEGLYNYKDENGMMGYKNLAGEVIIPPTFSQANPFLNGCALAFNNYAEPGFIDYQGHCIMELDKYENVSGNLETLCYNVFNTDNDDHYIIKANNTYNINSDDRILDINFNDKENNKILKKNG